MNEAIERERCWLADEAAHRLFDGFESDRRQQRTCWSHRSLRRAPVEVDSPYDVRRSASSGRNGVKMAADNTKNSQSSVDRRSNSFQSAVRGCWRIYCRMVQAAASFQSQCHSDREGAGSIPAGHASRLRHFEFGSDNEHRIIIGLRYISIRIAG